MNNRDKQINITPIGEALASHKDEAAPSVIYKDSSYYNANGIQVILDETIAGKIVVVQNLTNICKRMLTMRLKDLKTIS